MKAQKTNIDIPPHTPYNAIEYAFYSGGVEEDAWKVGHIYWWV